MYTKMRCLMINTKHEDAIMKMGFGYFRESILKRLGINCEIVLSGEIWYVRNNRTLKNSDLNMEENKGMTLQETMENEFSKLRKTSHIFHIISCYTEYDRTVRGGGR